MPQDQHWTETLFDEVYLKTYGSMLTVKETDLIAKVLELKPGERVLDLACGHGRHMIEFFTQELRLFPDGQVSERHFEVRLYALHELIALLSQAGFAYKAAYGDADASPYAVKSPRTIVIATKEE